MLGIPVKVSAVSESTVLGAAMFAFAGAGVYSSADAARAAFGVGFDVCVPGGNAAFYRDAAPRD